MWMQLVSRSVLTLLNVALLIQMVHPEIQAGNADHRHQKEAQHDRVPLDVPWPISVNVGTHDREALTKDFCHCPGSPALCKPARVDTEPGGK